MEEERMFTFWFPFKILPLTPSSAMAMLKIHQRKVQVNVDQKMRRRKVVFCVAVWRLFNINLKLESSFHFQLAVFFLPLILPAQSCQNMSSEQPPSFIFLDVKSSDFSFLINYNENLNRTQCNREKPLLYNISINGIKILRISKHKANGAFNIMADVGLNQKHCGYGALQTFQNFLFLSNILSVSWRREGRLIRILFQVSDI